LLKKALFSLCFRESYDIIFSEKTPKEGKNMVKHVILWTLKEGCNTPEIKAGIKARLEALQGVVPGLVEIKVVTEPLPTSNADVMLWSVMESAEALAVYAKHPEHVAAANEAVIPFAASRVCMDFED
jgi:hypothetical protein